jgi:hypothetical protein
MSADEKREQFRKRLERHRRARSGDFVLPVSRNGHAPWDSLAVRIYFAGEPSGEQLERLGEYVAAFHLVGVRGAFGGYVHLAELCEQSSEGDEPLAQVMLDLGSAPQPALDGFLRGLTSLWVDGLPIDRVVLGWTEEEANSSSAD